MPLKAIANVAAMALFVAYFTPLVVKLKDIPLTIAVLGGIVLVAIDLWQSFSDRSG